MSAAFAISNHRCTPVAANDNFVLPACSNAPCEHKVIQLYPKSEPKIGSPNRFIHGPPFGARCARVYNAAGRLVHVDNVATAKQEDYLYAGGMMIGRRDQNGAIAITHTDHLGGTVSQTDGAGNVQWRQRYSPFGGELDNTTGTDDRAGFTGHIKDSATGLNYMQARYYDPVIGRFLSIDPVTFLDSGDPFQFNRYAYSNNDPINMIDPDGQDAITVRFADQKIRMPNSKRTIPQWISRGHSGSLIVRSDGLTKYREYGRYPGGGAVSGAVRSTTMSDLKFESGVPTAKSLKKVFGQLLDIGKKAGSDDLRLSFDLSADNFDTMMDTAKEWDQNVKYSVMGETCHDFCSSVTQSGMEGNKRSRGDRFSQKLTPDNIDEAVSNVRENYQNYEENR